MSRRKYLLVKFRPSDPGILPAHRHALIISAVSHVRAVAITDFDGLLAVQGSRTSGSHAGIPLEPFGLNLSALAYWRFLSVRRIRSRFVQEDLESSPHWDFLAYRTNPTPDITLWSSPLLNIGPFIPNDLASIFADVFRSKSDSRSREYPAGVWSDRWKRGLVQ